MSCWTCCKCLQHLDWTDLRALVQGNQIRSLRAGRGDQASDEAGSCYAGEGEATGAQSSRLFGKPEHGNGTSALSSRQLRGLGGHALTWLVQQSFGCMGCVGPGTGLGALGQRRPGWLIGRALSFAAHARAHPVLTGLRQLHLLLVMLVRCAGLKIEYLQTRVRPVYRTRP